MLKIDVIQSVRELERLLPAWRQLAVTPFQQPEWLLAWWEQFKTPKLKLLVLALRDPTGELIGLAPFYQSRYRWLGRGIHLLGDGRACSDFQSILSREPHQQEVGETTADWLMNSREEIAWNALEFDGIAAGDVTMDWFAQRCHQLGCRIHVTAKDHTWRLDLSEGWEGFMSRLSKGQRSQCRNFVNRFDKNDSLESALTSGDEAVQRALAACMELHRQRWNACGEEGCFNDARFCRFIQDACSQFAPSQQVELISINKDGRTIASQLLFLDRSSNAYIYQSGRDPQLEKMRIGTILNLVVIREACDRGLASLDYLRGDEVYKARLGAEPTACECLRVIAPEAISQFQDAIHVVGRSAVNAFSNRLRHWSSGFSST